MKKFICEKCGKVFSECGTHNEYHPYGDGCAAESWACCPSCGSEDFEEAIECKRCGEYFAESKSDYDICADCQKEVMKEFQKKVLENFEDYEIAFIVENWEE